MKIAYAATHKEIFFLHHYTEQQVHHKPIRKRKQYACENCSEPIWMYEDEYLDISSQDAVLCSVCTANLFNFSQHTRDI